MTVDLCMLIILSMTLTLIQWSQCVDVGNGKTNWCCMLPAAKQAIRIKLATTVFHFYVTVTLQKFTLWLDQVVSPSSESRREAGDL